MKHFWKPFAALGTGLRRNVFRWTRVKLTLLYLGIIAVILIAFSLVLYYSFTQNIQDNFGGDYPNDQAQTAAVAKTTDQLQTNLLLIDVAILLASSGMSYFLAGKTLKPIQQMMERQKQFTADASHELRTPLAVIQANLEVALREKSGYEEKARALMRGAVDEVKSMAKLTDDLLLLSRMENGGTARKFEREDLNTVVRQITEKMQSIARGKEVRLTAGYSTPAFIEGNAEMLQRLVGNIVGNALAFTPPGGSVQVDVGHRGKEATIRVHDTGVGIAKKDLSHVTERFYRSDKARSHGGSGLGLSIAAEIVREHHGAIDIESEEGKGTTVTVAFPALS